MEALSIPEPEISMLVERLLVWFATLMPLVTGASFAATALRVPPGTMTLAPAGTPAERITVSASLGQQLLARPAAESTVVADWPIGPGERGTLVLHRMDVYAPNAHIYLVGPRGPVEVPRSPLAFWNGDVVEQPGAAVMIAFDPKSGVFHSYINRPDGDMQIELASASGDSYFVAAPEAFRPAGSPPLQWSCGGSEDVAKFSSGTTLPLGAVGEPPKTTFRLRDVAIIAVDTDNELMNLKFGNDASAAVNYIATLFADMNVIYNRDLNVQLLQGTTILRPSTTPDPYSQTSGGGAATQGELDEVSTYWGSTCGTACSSVTRTAVMMLSGKGSSNGASGIAWVPGLCSSAFGYSFSQVFLFSANTASFDVQITAHELGHNFGSRHTHCYTPPADTCFSGEPGCFSGTPSCPAPQTINGIPGVTGTLMSYCHLLGGCGVTNVFHPASVAIITPFINSARGVCINTALYFDDLESGNLNGWNGGSSP